ncbi:MAG: conjugal transfer protein TraF [Armatimonadota bacterium]|nr:conjugal transfer protein TraF [Armatimonadota bacterium]MCX7778439.1 conjugal transfer protein TraF [Armatimonadota bacterium]MDW8026355.1 conjugal transfer protein TraF [Armatimonadota bacterium]
MRITNLACAALALTLSISTILLGQEVGPKTIDRSFQRPGARALGMGGAYLLATDDATAVAWNPAALGRAKRLSIPVELTGRTNFDVQDAEDIVDDLEAIRDQIGIDNIDAIRGAFNRVRDFGQKYPTMSSSITPIAGLSFGRFGLCALSGAIAKVDTRVDSATGEFGLDPLPLQNLYARGGAMVLTSIGLAYAHPFRGGVTAGLTLRGVRADFAGFLLGATTDTTAPDPIIGEDFDRVDKTRFTVDVGLLWEPPVQPPATKLCYAAVVRNLLPTKFDLPATSNGASVAGYDFSFRLNPQIDIGVLAKLRGQTTGVLELHNITSSNGGDMSLHAGIEHWLGNTFAIRVGYDDDRFVFGLGINLKFIRVDLASGFKPRERLAVGVSLRF